MKTHKHEKKRIIAKHLAFSNLFKQKTFFLILPLLFFFILSKSLFAQDNCDDAVEVEADTVCNMESYEFSTSEYWLYFEIGSTSNYQISAHEIKGNITAMYVYSGDCGNLNLLDSVSNSAYVWYISTIDSLADGTYYIKIETEEDEGEFELCLTNFNPCFTHDTVCVGDSTHFFNCSLYPTTTWKWYFGDGDSSNVENPVHLYDSAGVYYVQFYANGTSYPRTDSVIVRPYPEIVQIVGYFIYCDSLHWDSILNPSPHSYYLWSYDAINWNDTIRTNPFIIEMPYSDTIIWVMAVDSLAGCPSEPTQVNINSCCGEEYLFWDNITITSDTTLSYDTLAINGTIIIEDCEVRLGNMMVYLNSHAKIEVIGTGSLYLEHDSLMICPGMDYMWDGIYVMDDSALVHGGATYIRDAKNAMVIKNCGDYHFDTFYFDNNYKAMWIDSCNKSIIDSLHTVNTTHFICSDPAEMLLPYYNQRSYVGIQINEVDSIQIGGSGSILQKAPYNQRNHFENLDYGIHNTNSNLFVFKVGSKNSFF
jgi:hypothetical protein